MTTGPLVVVGDALLDRDVDGTVRRLCPDSPAPVLDEPTAQARPGGAALAAQLAALAGHEVTLVCPLGDDSAAEQIRRLLHPRVRLVPLPWQDAAAQKTRVRVDGRTLLRIDHPARPYTGTRVRCSSGPSKAPGRSSSPTTPEVSRRTRRCGQP